MKVRHAVVAFVSATLLSALLAAHAQPMSAATPFASKPEKSSLELDELRIWDEAGDFDKALRRRGSLYGVAEVDRYLQGVLDELFPEFKGAVRVRTVNNPDLNAFALPNGSIYIHLGLLARLENEAQLAAVLAHEGAHFVYRHGHQRAQSHKTGAAFALGLSMIGGAAGVGDIAGLLGQMAIYSSTYGFSREHEREADRVGFERMVRLGYDTDQGARVFELLRDEAKLLDEKEPVMFSSHPKLEERIESFKELRARHPDSASLTRTDEDRFLAATAGVRPDWIQQAFGFSRYKSIIHVLEQVTAAKRFPEHFPYYLGEAYRLRNEKEDPEKAMRSYNLALERSPDYASTYRSLGLLHMYGERKEEARAMFEKYLALRPEADDAAFVKTYIQQTQ